MALKKLLTKDKMTVAVVGYGGMGGWHADKLKTIKCVELAGVYDILPERNKAAEKKGIKAYESFEALLADENIDLVTIAIPNDQHKDVCIRAMAAGKNVVCEKPVALSSDEVTAMIDASIQYGVIFTVHQNRRWDEDYLIVKRMFDENSLGRVFNIESRVHGSRGIPGDWRNQKQYGGGMVLDWGVHLLDQILMMVQKPIKSVYSTFSFVTNEGVEDGFKIIITYEGDLQVLVEVGTSNFINLPRWYVQGENGSAVIKSFACDGKVTMVSDWENRDAVPVVTAAGLTKTMAPRTSDTIREYPIERIDSDVRDYYRNLNEVLRGNGEQLIKHDEILRCMKLMEAVFKSAETNEVVTNIF